MTDIVTQARELKLCPFCGGSRIELERAPGTAMAWRVRCLSHELLCASITAATKASAIKKWNTRQPVSGDVVEKAARAIEEATKEQYFDYKAAARAALASLQDRRPKLAAESDEPKSYADWQQRRGMAMDTIDWIIAEYDGFMQDDHYDPYGFMDRLFTKLRTKRQALESKTHG